MMVYLLKIDRGDFKNLKKIVRPEYISDLELIAKKKYFEQLSSREYSKNYRLKAERLLLRTGVNIRFKEFVLLNIAVAVGVVVLAQLLFNNPLITLIALYVGYKLPFLILEYLARKNQEEIDEHIDQVLAQIGNIFGTIGSLEKSIEETIGTMPSPLKEEFAKTISDMKVAGLTLGEALQSLAVRLNNKDFDFWVKISLLTTEIGGETRELMLQIPETIRERKSLRDELSTELSGTKFQGWILFAGTPILFLIYKIMRPDFASILTDTLAGKIITSFVALVCILSLWLIEKISKPV
jgi:tight adherence protein B